MDYVSSIGSNISQSIPSVIYAVILLIIAWWVAGFCKNLTIKVLKKTKAEKYADKIGIVDEKTDSSLEFLGKLVYIVVFLLFLPGVLDKLGMQSVSTPITSLVSQFLNFVPNIIAAGIMLVIGLFVANIIRQLLTPVLKRFNVDKIQEKAGISTTENTSLSSVVSYIIYVLILIPIIITVLQILNISAISDPAVTMLNKIMMFLPNIFVAIAIVIIGGFIAKIVGNLLKEILSGIGADRITKSLVPVKSSKLNNVSVSDLIGKTIKYIIILLFVVEAINVIELEILQTIGAAIIAYLPFAISAIIIMWVGVYLATWLESLIKDKFTNAKLTALITKFTIITLAVFMSLNQLGIANSIVNAAFIIILGALAVAFAIAFGIGGREFASNVLKKLEKNIFENENTNDGKN